MLLLVRPFHALICATVQPCLSAILPSTSPFLTIYVTASDGACAEVVETEDEVEADEVADTEEEDDDDTPPLYMTSL